MSAQTRIIPIVEGHGDEAAVPILLRRLQEAAEDYNFGIGQVVRRNRSDLVRKRQLQASVEMALGKDNCAAILILFDADDDCPKELASTLESWAQERAGVIPCAVVMANREYEAWFLATLESLKGCCGVEEDAVSLSDPEVPRGAKEILETFMHHPYAETDDQPAMTAAFNMAAAYQRCRSFRKLVKTFGELAQAVGASIPVWPPTLWILSAL